MKFTIYISLLVILTILTSCHSPKLTARIEFSKDTMMLGEEVQWDFVVTNVSKKPISIYYDPRGNYHNELYRDADLKVLFMDTTNKIVTQIHSNQYDVSVGGGRVGFRTIEHGQELRFPQWFNDWYKLEKSGNYKISIEKSLCYDETNWKNVYKVRASGKKVYFYNANLDDRIANIHLLEDRFRMGKFKDSEDLSYTLEAISRSASETSIDFYEELLNGKNSYNTGLAIRGLGKLSPSQKAFSTLVRYFDIGFVNSIEETINPQLKESMLEGLFMRTLYEIEKFPPEMTIYFLNKIIADKKYEGAIKNKAMQIISPYKRE
ncbi:MAG TPA: hypothetical protein VK169_01680 [Saprospiraceae bacterium]|nr:hypothetical protein [Saprospiraceae bacterium]